MTPAVDNSTGKHHLLQSEVTYKVKITFHRAFIMCAKHVVSDKLLNMQKKPVHLCKHITALDVEPQSKG